MGGAPTGGGIDLVISEVSPVHFAVSCFIELTSMAMTFTNKRRIFFRRCGISTRHVSGSRSSPQLTASLSTFRPFSVVARFRRWTSRCSSICGGDRSAELFACHGGSCRSYRRQIHEIFVPEKRNACSFAEATSVTDPSSGTSSPIAQIGSPSVDVRQFSV